MLVRCDNHPPRNLGKYCHILNPYGYPQTAAVCGVASCDNPGRMFLDKTEWMQHQRGKMVFGVMNTNFVKIKVAANKFIPDDPIEE